MFPKKNHQRSSVKISGGSAYPFELQTVPEESVDQLDASNVLRFLMESSMSLSVYLVTKFLHDKTQPVA